MTDKQVGVERASLEQRPGIFMIGSPNVGKRTLLSRLLSLDFEDASDSMSGSLAYGWTINTKYYTADVSVWMAHLHDDFSIEALPIYDGLAALVMVFDMSDLSSLAAIKDWVSGTDIKKFDILLCVGNKVDLLPGHSAHVEYRRRLQKLGESSLDSKFSEYGISETEGVSLLGDEEPLLEINKSCLEWCTEHNIEYIEACASNADFDRCLSVDGDLQGIERLYGALSAYMWPGMVLPKPSSLSARMSFVFDQIDAIERERSQKDETLQRIRAWRESKKNKNGAHNNAPGLGASELKPCESSSVETESGELEVKEEEEEKERVGLLNKEVELVHPWPEWIELMERLVQQNYFDHRRKDEDKMVEDLGFQISEVAEEGFDFTRDWKTVQTACLNFGRDRFDILRSLSRQDIQILVGYGCPSADKKVVFSAKLLRKHVHLDEGDVCSSCSLRSSCERAYLLTNKEDEARTIDIMRILLTYGFDPVNGSVVNESLLKIKSVKTVVRKLLHDVVKLSAVPIDPNLPPPVIKKPPPKVKQPPPPPKKRVGRDDIEMKKGDWLCPKCDFMNFAKNTVCLQCDAKRPQRQLLPGEWECPQCNFLNYRRNMVCFHCEHKRPPDEFTENQLQDRQRGPNRRLEKVPSRAEVSHAWNFDFDDNESDGADVAAFEYADSRKLDEDFPLYTQAQGENFRGPKDDSYMTGRTPRTHEREYSDPVHQKPGTGFDDFDDDDEDDDVNSYELDAQNNNQVQKSSSIEFSEVEGHSESEEVEGFYMDRIARQASSRLRNKPSKTLHRKEAFSGSEVDEQDFVSDDELPVHSNWKSSHAADSRERTRGTGSISFGSDEDYGLGSDTDDFVDEDFGSRQNKGNKKVSSNRNSRKRRIPDSDDEPFSGLESDDEDLPSPRGRLGGSNPNKRGNISKGRGDFKFSGDSRFGSNSMSSGRRNPFNDDFNRSSRGSRGGNGGFQRIDYGSSRGNNRGFQRDDHGGRRMNDGEGDDFNRSSRGSRGGNRGFQRVDYGGRRMNDREGDLRNSRSPNREGSSYRQRGGFNDFDRRSDLDRDINDDRPRRQRINVR